MVGPLVLSFLRIDAERVKECFSLCSSRSSRCVKSLGKHQTNRLLLPNITHNKFIVKDAAFNTIYAQNLEALATLCHLEGGADAQHLLDQARQTEKSILRYMCDKEDDVFYDLYGHDFRRLKVRTGTIFFPVVLKCVPQDVCRQVLERHLPAQGWLPCTLSGSLTRRRRACV